MKTGLRIGPCQLAHSTFWKKVTTFTVKKVTTANLAVKMVTTALLDCHFLPLKSNSGPVCCQFGFLPSICCQFDFLPSKSDNGSFCHQFDILLLLSISLFGINFTFWHQFAVNQKSLFLTIKFDVKEWHRPFAAIWLMCLQFAVNLTFCRQLAAFDSLPSVRQQIDGKKLNWQQNGLLSLFWQQKGKLTANWRQRVKLTAKKNVKLTAKSQIDSKLNGKKSNWQQIDPLSPFWKSNWQQNGPTVTFLTAKSQIDSKLMAKSPIDSFLTAKSQIDSKMVCCYFLTANWWQKVKLTANWWQKVKLTAKCKKSNWQLSHFLTA